MSRRLSNALFSANDFAAQLRATHEAMLREINGMQGDQLLNTTPSALVEYLVDRYRVDVPVLSEAATTVEQREGPVAVNRFEYDTDEIPGTWFDYYVPFVGEAAAFMSRASNFTFSPPRGEVHGSELTLSYGITRDSRVDVAQEFRTDLARVRQHLEWLRDDAASHNAGLARSAHRAIESRRQKLLDDRRQVAELGYPLRNRTDQPTYAVPTVRSKPKIQRPSGGTAPFVPEPVLEMSEYESVLRLMANVARAMELSPSAFRNLDEEDLRTHFLVQLNGQYQGQASGETFNLAGKTDIIIREGDRNIFIAECKFWDGPQALTRAIDQLLSYTSWRDTKTAILLFNRGKHLSTVLAKIPDTVLIHHHCLKRLEYASESGFRFQFRHPDDTGRELILTVLVFEVPK